MRKTKRVTEQKGFSFYRKNARQPVFYRVKRLHWRGEIRNKNQFDDASSPICLEGPTPMQNNSASQAAFLNFRVSIALLLCAFGASLGWLSFAASPSGGTITPSGPTLTWNGTAPGVPPTARGEPSRPEGLNCERNALPLLR